MDQNLGDTNVMYHKLLDQFFRSQSIKVSLREHNRAKGNGMDFKLVSEL